MKQKIAIIGAGITGLSVAKYLSDKNYNVTIYEKKSEIGGVMRDILDDQETYFKGPQFLNADSGWLKSFFNDEDIKKKFLCFKEQLYSYTELFGKTFLKKNTNQPLIPFDVKKISPDNRIIKMKTINNLSLKNRLTLYPRKISAKLEKWISNFSNEIDKLNQSACKIYGSRVVFQKNFKELDELKKNKILNIIYGKVPKNTKSLIIPKNGFNVFFDEIEKILKKNGVKIFKNVTLKSDKKQKNFYFDGKNLNYNYLIWTANPIPLLQVYNEKIDNEVLRVKILFSKIRKIKNLKPTYINVYSLKSQIFRIYLYNQNNFSKISIEVFNDRNNNNNKILKQTKKVLEKLKIDVNFVGKLIEKKEVRHIFLTQNDIKIFKKFKKKKPLNLIDGIWEQNLDREQKLSFFNDYVEANLN
tara:strand:- start:41438 stop:42679 length:1242 start_codon:yes stop_codon:yes gene_type:complete